MAQTRREGVMLSIRQFQAHATSAWRKLKRQSRLKSSVADAQTVDELFQLILGRPIGDEQFKRESHHAASIHYWVQRLVESEEFRARRHPQASAQAFIPDSTYRSPRLFPSAAPAEILISGSCLSEHWSQVLSSRYPEMRVRHVLFNNASELEDIPDHELRKFAFQIGQISLRSIIGEAEYFAGASSLDIPGDERARQLCLDRLRANFEALLKYNRQVSLPVFLLNFVVPQANPLGFLMPRYGRSNFVRFVEQLNEALVEMIEATAGVYLVDFDSICATLGKRYINDDMTNHLNHGAHIAPTHWPEDINLTPYGSIEDIYRPKVEESILALFNECLTSHYIISPSRKIKLVIFDLDGTLWRGIPAESDEIDYGRISEGWPLSLLEAAAFLKKRGILVAIASKNDPARGRDIYDKVYGKRLPLSHFASVKIDWESKVRNVGEILSEANLLPENCLFVDDNPVERGQVAAAYPGITVIDGPISTWKRTLLWSAELQTAAITEEAQSRTETVQKMIRRESLRAQMNPEDYLRGLQVKVDIDVVAASGDRKFQRVIELLNKTNQFNTTGRRWSEAELAAFFASCGRIYAASVADRLSNYGLAALLLQSDGVCQQMVMSCRVFGLRVEHALLDRFTRGLAAPGSARIAFRPTDKNGPSAKFLRSLGMDLTASHNGEIEFYPLPAQSLEAAKRDVDAA